jgi:citrate lyase beta subunit
MADKKLWEVMDDAFWATALTTQNRNWALCHAAALRALADEVAREEPEPKDDGRLVSDIEHAMWEQRMATRAKLLQAADEAEGK